MEQNFLIIYRKKWYSKPYVIGQTQSFEWAMELCDAYQNVYKKGRYSIKAVGKFKEVV